MLKIYPLMLLLCLSACSAVSQTFTWEKQEFTLKNVTASVVTLNGVQALKVERDLTALPFDAKDLSSTVDEPTYVRLKYVGFENGTIEVKVLSRLQNPLPFEAARGFIGVAFRINQNDSAFESIYLRPTNGRSESQFARNHTVQYFSYPEYKFDRLRRESEGWYETYADVGLNEWITLRIEIDGQKAKLYINHQGHPSFIVENMKGKTTNGAIALWVDIGTEGYFKDLKVTKK